VAGRRSQGELGTHGDADAYRQRHAHAHPHRHANFDAFTDCNTHSDPDRGATHAAAHAVEHGPRLAPLPGDGDGACSDALTDADAGLYTVSNLNACTDTDEHPEAGIIAASPDSYIQTRAAYAGATYLSTKGHTDTTASSTCATIRGRGRRNTIGIRPRCQIAFLPVSGIIEPIPEIEVLGVGTQNPEPPHVRLFQRIVARRPKASAVSCCNPLLPDPRKWVFCYPVSRIHSEPVKGRVI
jgi:hypothetical protein